MTHLSIQKTVEYSLWEDLQDIGDITADTLIPLDKMANARIFAKEDGILYGTEYITETFRQINPDITVEIILPDGSPLQYGDTIAKLHGPVRHLLTGERTALNFTGHLSGVATTTHKAVTVAKPHGVTVACTRKTTPLYRNAEKYAVRAGGGSTHRFGLYDAVMIKDNHLVVEPDIVTATKTVQKALKAQGKSDTVIEVEVDTLQQLTDVLPTVPDVILLDNMPPEMIAQAINIRADMGKTSVKLEASGNITPDTLESYCATGVDIISMGWLTHSAKNFDVSMEVL